MMLPHILRRAASTAACSRATGAAAMATHSAMAFSSAGTSSWL